MRNANPAHLLSVFVFLAALSPGSARSDGTADPADPAPQSSGRTLNGHAFMPAVDVPWPFTVTSLTADLVLGYGETTGTIQVRDETFEGTLKYAGTGGFLGYEYAFRDRFSVRGVINELVYSGINGKSALAVGTELRLGFGVGATASLPIGDTARVGFLFDFLSNPSLALTVASGLNAIADSCSQPSGCKVDLSQILSSSNVLTIQPALAASWAPSRTLGLTANVAYQHFSSTGKPDVSGDAIDLGVAADYDFGAMSSVPIGLQAQFTWASPISATGVQHVTDLGGGIFYTARKDLSAGVQILARRFAVTPGLNVSWRTFISTAGLRAYW